MKYLWFLVILILVVPFVRYIDHNPISALDTPYADQLESYGLVDYSLENTPPVNLTLYKVILHFFVRMFNNFAPVILAILFTIVSGIFLSLILKRARWRPRRRALTLLMFAISPMILWISAPGGL